MSEPARNRFALDLDDLERQLRGAAQAPRPGQSVDPLAELTRIVGQDDPLKDLFNGRAQPAPAQVAPAAWQQPVRHEPTFEAASEYEPAAVAKAAPPAELRGALDEFEALLRRTDDPRPAIAPAAFVPAKADAYAGQDEADFDLPEPLPYSRPAPAAADFPVPRDLDQDGGHYGYASHGQDHEAFIQSDAMDDQYEPEPEPRRSRKGLWTVAALLGVGVIGAGAAMTFRGSEKTIDGQPPVISANTGPTKVQPANPGGAEIPNQNKQIYDRAGDTPAAATKVVSREEQPVDVQQAARAMAPRVVLPGPSSATPETSTSSNPLAQAPAAPERVAAAADPVLTPVPQVPGLGEPRRVRTVSIKPDGTPAPATAAYANGSAAPVTGSAPTRPVGSLPTASATAPASVPPIPTAGTNPPPRPRAAATPATTPESAKVQERVAAPAAATTPAPPLRIANAAPAPAVSPVASTGAIRSGTGDFAVQLAAPGSEAEARATYSALQRKYPDQLGSQNPIVRKTDLAGGKTVYRLRVGPYSRDDATTMCTALQAAGGQCFIAKN
ncbi:SPOR domain-containing protein [Bosea sp. PAMC 26642]|uniref:SPOR domain-containing protein n=1 Tax=Bosea sp. (strain PAMC 26642) TaxID=1792307 RepID=UPI0007704F89|nr:SPOR domain-containing protein [Bosea sp. PAMC 26642]AMJ60230.1 hypothetical protein AXW83_07910 [Bosea sp. PAMC 26642]